MNKFRIFLSGFAFGLVLLGGGAAFYLFSANEPAVEIPATKPPVPQLTNLFVKLHLPAGLKAPPLGANWTYEYSFSKMVNGQPERIGGGSGAIPSGPPYQLKLEIPKTVLSEALGDAASVPLQFSFAFCQGAKESCELRGGSFWQSVNWLQLDRERLLANDLDLGNRAFNFVKGEATPAQAATCPNNEIKTEIMATAESLPLLNATKQVLVLIPPGTRVFSNPVESAKLWMKEVSFQQGVAKAVASMPRALNVGDSVGALVAFCKKGTSDADCVRNSGAWNVGMRSFPYSKDRKYVQLVSKGFAPVSCGGSISTLHLHVMNEKQANEGFDGIPASVPSEIRTSPWAAICPGCATFL